MKAIKEKKEKGVEEAKEGDELGENSREISPKGNSDDGDSYDDNFGHEQSEYNDRLAQDLDFSDEEDIINDGMVELRNAAQYLAYKPKNRDKNAKRILPKVDESRYFAAIESKKPKTQEANDLKNYHKKL